MIKKFRAFDLKTGLMINHQMLMEKQYPQHIKRPPYYYDVFDDGSLIINSRSVFKDINGDDIFEGDVIETKESKAQRFCYEVVIDDETGNWMVEPFMKGRFGWKVGYSTTSTLQPLLDIVKAGAYIIGNKYQNKELYKKGV